jgi:periplasmic copper chaperone A
LGRLAVLGLLITAAGVFYLMVHPEPVAQQAGVSVIHPWAKGAARAQQSLPIYVVLRNDAAVDDTLLGVERPVAKLATVKRIDGREGMVRATELPVIVLPAQGRLAFRPGRMQITLVDLDRSVAPGDDLPIIFRFARAGVLNANVRIESIGMPEHVDHF